MKGEKKKKDKGKGKEKGKLVSVILATYNEKENLAKMIPIIEDIFKKNRTPLEIVVVDDNSPDGTSNIARQMNRKYHNVRLLWRPRKMGPGSAHADGYRFARGDIVVGMDVDFSHNPNDIPRFIRKINQGYDVVENSRFIKGGGYEVKSFATWQKSVISRLGNLLISFLSGVPIHDFTCSMRAIRKEVINNVDTESKGNSYFFEFLIKAHRKGYKIAEIPIAFKDRVVGKSKLKLGMQSLKALKDVFKYALFSK